MNRTALPVAVPAPTEGRDRAYVFAVVACYGLQLTERQRTAVVDAAALMVASGAPASAAHLLAAVGMPRPLVRAMIRLLDGFDPSDWTVVRRETRSGQPAVDDLARVVTVPAWLGYDFAVDLLAGYMEEATRPEVKQILGRRRDWTSTTAPLDAMLRTAR